MDDVFKPVLREMNPEKLTQFVECCSGYHYIPPINENNINANQRSNDVFDIVVEFIQDAKVDDDSLPVSHMFDN
jgi:hypothetical protein